MIEKVPANKNSKKERKNQKVSAGICDKSSRDTLLIRLTWGMISISHFKMPDCKEGEQNQRLKRGELKRNKYDYSSSNYT